jgi:pimeloyl-ACP methyl ester carboxylesterase
VRIRDADLYYEDTGGAGETILFLHGFLFDGRQYAAQVAALRDRYRCVTLDFRGQGRSTGPRGGYQVEQQVADVLTMIRRLGLAPVHLVGLSMGGFVALRIAARQPELLRSMTLLNTSAAAHARVKFPKQLVLAAIGRTVGVDLAPVRAGIEGELFGRPFRTDPATAAERETWRQRRAGADRVALVQTLLGFMIRPDVLGELGDVSVPTLVIAGAADVSLPPSHSRDIHSRIPGSHLVELPGAGHSSPIEDPAGVTRALERFFERPEAG